MEVVSIVDMTFRKPVIIIKWTLPSAIHMHYYYPLFISAAEDMNRYPFDYSVNADFFVPWEVSYGMWLCVYHMYEFITSYSLPILIPV